MYVTFRFVVCTACALSAVWPHLAVAQKGWTVVHPAGIEIDRDSPYPMAPRTLEHRWFGHERHRRDEILRELVDKYGSEKHVEIAEIGGELFHVYRWFDHAKEQAEELIEMGKRIAMHDLRHRYVRDKNIGPYVLKDVRIEFEPREKGRPFSVELDFGGDNDQTTAHLAITGTMSYTDPKSIPPPEEKEWQARRMAKGVVYASTTPNGVQVLWYCMDGHTFAISGISTPDDPLLTYYLDRFPPPRIFGGFPRQ